MREWCSCGASIRARRKDVLTWRTTHRHDTKTEEPEPDKNGASAQVETAWQPGFTGDPFRVIPDIQARIGFTPNGYTIRSVELANQLRAKALKNLGRDE